MLNKFCSAVAMIGLSFSFYSCGTGLNRFSSLEELEGGFGFYRSGQPDGAEIDELCKKGVKKIFALNGQAGRYQQALSDKCPETKVVFNEEQDPDTGLTAEFLEKFDLEVQSSKAEGSGVLIHCYCGCHRTGRLAAYYRMKYQQWTAKEAIDEMMAIGKDMDSHPTLSAQVVALEDHIKGRPCGQSSNSCVR